MVDEAFLDFVVVDDFLVVWPLDVMILVHEESKVR